MLKIAGYFCKLISEQNKSLWGEKPIIWGGKGQSLSSTYFNLHCYLIYIHFHKHRHQPQTDIFTVQQQDNDGFLLKNSPGLNNFSFLF